MRVCMFRVHALMFWPQRRALGCIWLLSNRAAFKQSCLLSCDGYVYECSRPVVGVSVDMAVTRMACVFLLVIMA